MTASLAQAHEHGFTYLIERGEEFLTLLPARPDLMSVAIRPQRQIVSSAASSSVRPPHLSTNVCLEWPRSGSSVRGSNSTMTKRRAKSSEAVAGKDHEGRCVQRHHLRFAEGLDTRGVFRNRARKEVGPESGVVQIVEE
jgi:hypothetical protein